MTFSLTSCSESEPDLDYASKIVGEYVGTADIVSYGKIKGAKVDVRRSSNNFVIVNFYYADNTNFFNGSYTYEIMKDGDAYILSSDNSSIDEIYIKNGELTAEGYVRVSGKAYIFEFEGTRQ